MSMLLRSRNLGRGRLRDLSSACSAISACTARSPSRSTTAPARIKAELDEARKLKDEAQRSCSPNISASGARPRSEAQAIIAGAKAEAERLAAEAKTKIEEFVARRTKMAETKIAQAEAQAAADVRSAAAEAAVAAAEKILTQETKGKLAGELIAKGIEDVRKKLN